MVNLLTAPIFDDEDKTMVARHLFIISWTLIAIGWLPLILAVFIPETAYRWFLVTGYIETAALILFVLNKYGHTRSAKYFLIFTIWAAATGMALTGGGIRSNAMSIYLITVLIAGLVQSGKTGFITAVLCSLTGLFLVFLEYSGALPANTVTHTPFTEWIANTIYMFIIISFQYLVSGTIRRALEQSRQEMKERKRVDAALRKSEEQYRTLVENASDMVFRTDENGYYTFVNSVVLHYTGYKEDEIIGKHYKMFFSPETFKKTIALMANQLGKKIKNTYYEYPIITKDGHDLWVGQNMQLIMEDGHVTGYQGISRDITERKHAENALQESEENFRRSLDESPLGIRIVTIEGETIYANRVILDFYGYKSLEELKATPVEKHYTKESFAEHKIRKEKRERGELAPSQYEISIVRKNGKIRQLQALHKEILWNGVKQAQVIYQDITERKRANEALRTSEEKYRNILENIEESYYEVDLAGNLTFFNDSMCQTMGYTREELMGMNNRYFTSKENAEKLFQAFNKVYRTGKPGGVADYEIIRKDGTSRYVGTSISLRKDSSDKPIGFNGIIRDTTERKRAEAEILALSITDPLTGLHNRRGFLSLVEQQLKISDRNKQGVQLYFADLDGLKLINDTLGHVEGDKALIEAATLFKETFRTSDIIARLGGDEFAALAIDATRENSEIFTDRLKYLIDTRNKQEKRRYKLSISVGFSFYDPENPCSLDELMAHADKLMYEQKQNKKDILLQGASLSNGNPHSNYKLKVDDF